MTVSEIKEYIIQEISFREKELEHHEIKIDTKDHINSLEHILSMLDELDIPQELIDEEREHYITDGVLDELEPKGE